MPPQVVRPAVAPPIENVPSIDLRGHSFPDGGRLEPIGGAVAGLSSSFGQRLTQPDADDLVKGLENVNPGLYRDLMSLPPGQRLYAVSLLLEQRHIGDSHEIIRMREIAEIKQTRERFEAIKLREAEIIWKVYRKDVSQVTDQELRNPPDRPVLDMGKLRSEWLALHREERTLVKSVLGYADGSNRMYATMSQREIVDNLAQRALDALNSREQRALEAQQQAFANIVKGSRTGGLTGDAVADRASVQTPPGWAEAIRSTGDAIRREQEAREAARQAAVARAQAAAQYYFDHPRSPGDPNEMRRRIEAIQQSLGAPSGAASTAPSLTAPSMAMQATAGIGAGSGLPSGTATITPEDIALRQFERNQSELRDRMHAHVFQQGDTTYDLRQLTRFDPDRDTLYLTVPTDRGPRVVNIRFLPEGKYVATARDAHGQVTEREGLALIQRAGIQFHPVALGDRRSYQISLGREGVYGVHTHRAGEGSTLGIGPEGQTQLEAQAHPPARFATSSIRIPAARMRELNRPDLYRMLFVQAGAGDAIPVDLNLVPDDGRRYETGYGYCISRERDRNGEYFRIDFTDGKQHQFYTADPNGNGFEEIKKRPRAWPQQRPILASKAS